MTENLFCPNISTCEIYKEFKEKSYGNLKISDLFKDKIYDFEVLNISKDEKSGGYFCVALEYIKTSSQKNTRQISKTNLDGIKFVDDCLFIKQLNLLDKLSQK